MEATQEEKLIDKDRMFKVPAALGLAMSSERGELVQLVINGVKTGEVKIDEDLVCELLALIANLIHDKREAKTKLFRVSEEMEYAEEQVVAAAKSLAKVQLSISNANAILSDTDIEEDE